MVCRIARHSYIVRSHCLQFYNRPYHFCFGIFSGTANIACSIRYLCIVVNNYVYMLLIFCCRSLQAPYLPLFLKSLFVTSINRIFNPRAVTFIPNVLSIYNAIYMPCAITPYIPIQNKSVGTFGIDLYPFANYSSR